jgi:hypothetical protein
MEIVDNTISMKATEAQKQQMRAYYKRNQARLIAQSRAYGRVHKADKSAKMLRLRQKFRSYVLEYKKTHHCVDCPESDPTCLDFDHRDPAQKKYNIAQLMQASYAMSTLIAEMAKCDVRCSNCHRKRTAREGHTRRRN